MRAFVELLKSIRGMVWLTFGLAVYWLTKRTPPMAHQGLIRAFCISSGRSNDFLSRIVAASVPKLNLPDATGVLGSLTVSDLSAYSKSLERDGYLVFPGVLAQGDIDHLMAFALGTKARRRLMDNQSSADEPAPKLYEPQNPTTVRYEYETQDLIDDEAVQGLLADHSLLALAQEYLGNAPKADILSMWWHTNFHAQPDSEAAQFYHFDMDRIRWLKVFIYLTDVGPADGPHSFIVGSHRSGGIPPEFLRRGYVRLTDEDVYSHYGKAREVEFSAPKGTIIVEDTRGLHKGKHVAPGGNSRLVLQLQFSNSLFGCEMSQARFSNIVSPQLSRLVKDAAPVYRQFLKAP